MHSKQWEEIISGKNLKVLVSVRDLVRSVQTSDFTIVNLFTTSDSPKYSNLNCPNLCFDFLFIKMILLQTI